VLAALGSEPIDALLVGDEVWGRGGLWRMNRKPARLFSPHGCPMR
jgi:hypothetical protein